MASTRQELIEELKEEFGNSDLSVAVDEKTGAITFDASILFDYNKCEFILKKSRNYSSEDSPYPIFSGPYGILRKCLFGLDSFKYLIEFGNQRYIIIHLVYLYHYLILIYLLLSSF